MIKGKDYGEFSCISKNGNPKSRWNTSDEVIEQAKYLTDKFHKNDGLKLIGYKCVRCHKYHLTTHKKRVRKF